MTENEIIINLTNESGYALIIPNAKTLTISGTAFNNAPERLLIQSAANSANGSLIFTNPGANTDVQATVQMYSKAFKGAPQTFTDPITGTYTVSYRWQYFGIPVQNAVYNTTFEAAAPVSYVRVSNESKYGDDNYYNEWDQLYTDAGLTSFTGYEITQNVSPGSGKLITFKGPLVTPDQTLTLTYSPNATTGNAGSGSNIFGNSFTAAIDINKIVFNEPTKVAETVYIYNTGSLADWHETDPLIEPGSFVAIPKVVSPAIQREIPSMQGFMLIASAATTVTIPYSAVLNNSVAQRVKPTDNADFSFLTADVIGKSDAERVWLFSQPKTSHAYDNGWDGRKILPGGLTLYTDEMDEKLQVSTSDDLDGTYLALKAGSDTEYTLRINKSKLTGYKTLYLTDLETNTVTDLSALDEINYTFTATNTTNAVRRFLITSKDKKNNNGTKGPKVKIFNSGSTIRIDNPSDENGTVLIFDMFGQLRQTGVMNAASVTEITTSLPPSVYAVRVQAAGIDQSGKIVIRH